MGESLIIVLNSGFDSRNEIGGWVGDSIDQLERSIKARLEREHIPATIRRQPIESASRTDATSVHFIEFVIPEDEEKSALLLEDARLARLHAALARAVDDAQMEASRLSPVFPIIAAARRRVAAEVVQRGKKPDKKNQRKGANRGSTEAYHFSERFRRAAGSADNPDFVRFSGGADPQSAHPDYALAVVERVKRCPLQSREITSLTISDGVRTVVKELHRGDVLNVLQLLFKVTHSLPRKQNALTRLIRWAQPARNAIHIVARNESELRAALAGISRDSDVLVWAATFEPRKTLGDVAALGERLGRLCYEIYAYEAAVRCLLPAMRLDPMRMMAETADLCLVRLGSPNALRATQEVAQRYRQSVSGEKPDAAKQVEILSIAALGREWRHFGAGHRIESDGSSRYATYKTCLRELDEWLDRARDKKGAFIAREREWMRPFYVNWQLELGEDVDQEWTANPEPNHWVSLQRARFLLATERFSEAAEAMERESSRMPEGSLSAEEPRALFYVAFSILSGLLGVLYKGSDPDPRTWYVRAREAMDTFDAIVARRGFPFDRDLEVQLRRGLRTKWRTAVPAIGDERLSYQRLGLSTGLEWPALSRVDFAMILLDYAELCMRCEEMTTARSSIKSTLALLDLTKNKEVPARGFTGPLSARMALPAALALAMQARLFDEPEALKTALAWASWDCSDEVNGAGRKAYYSRVLTWCSAGTPMHKPVQTWLSR